MWQIVDRGAEAVEVGTRHREATRYRLSHIKRQTMALVHFGERCYGNANFEVLQSAGMGLRVSHVKVAKLHLQLMGSWSFDYAANLMPLVLQYKIGNIDLQPQSQKRYLTSGTNYLRPQGVDHKNTWQDQDGAISSAKLTTIDTGHQPKYRDTGKS